jgi:hypothetical protein
MWRSDEMRFAKALHELHGNIFQPYEQQWTSLVDLSWRTQERNDVSALLLLCLCIVRTSACEYARAPSLYVTADSAQARVHHKSVRVMLKLKSIPLVHPLAQPELCSQATSCRLGRIGAASLLVLKTGRQKRGLCVEHPHRNAHVEDRHARNHMYVHARTAPDITIGFAQVDVLAVLLRAYQNVCMFVHVCVTGTGVTQLLPSSGAARAAV